MVAEAVSQAKGEPQKIIPKTSIEMPIKASIPAEYISKEDIRLEAYRKLANATSYEAVEGIRGSWIDRFGPIPQTAETLIDTALLRVTCLNRGITNITASNASPEQVRMARTRLASSRLASRSSRHSTSRRTNREDISAGAEKIYAVNISPIGLRASSEVRLARLYPSAVYKDKSHEISLLIDSNPHKLPSTIDQLITDLLP
jgi:transcription-repair coupling factor (superfamily II helicase)